MAVEQEKIQLSKRELQVLELVVTGASNQEIAQQLVISLNTVKVHLRNIFGKLDVQSRTEATIRAIQEGLIHVSDNGDAATVEQAEPIVTKTFLLDTNPPLVLLKWQQIYFFIVLLLALLIATLPWLPQSISSNAPNIPIPHKFPGIYKSDPFPVPPPADGNLDRWTSHPAIAGGRAGLALVNVGESIFAIGGVKDNNTTTRLVEIYNTETRTWSEGNNKPTAATDISAAVFGDKIYVPGGCTPEGQAMDVLEIYTPSSDEWSKAQSLPEARCAYGLVTYQDSLYLFGGWNGEAFEDSIFIYTPENDTWTISEYTLPQPLGYMGTAVLQESIYLVGGYNDQTEHNTTYTFDPPSGQWQEKAPMLEKRGGLGLISNGRSLYAVGGGWNHNLTSSEKYDPASDSWTPFETPSSSQWRNMGLTIAGNAIYAVGGWDGATEEFVNEVSSYQVAFQTFFPVSIR
ncbi:MAG: hypothetical protein KDJ52_09680 [Anaerolineae bacterium]|nr:hypothetical protein [Anaerolineae bacterium]